MSVKLSIIVPIYNKAAYLEKSLNSILNQTYNDYEVILVDDGSIDGSPQICKEICEKDARFKYFHKSNGGVASARNYGLECATGEYIGFVDPDDYIKEDMFLKLLEKAETNNADIVACGVLLFENGQLKELKNPSEEHMKPQEAATHLLSWDGEVSTYLWNKIFRKKIVDGIRFNENLKVGEDTPFIFQCLVNAKLYVHVNDYLYIYVNNIDSLVGSGYKRMASLNSVESSLYIVSLCKEKYREYFEISQYSLVINSFFQICNLLHFGDLKVDESDYSYFEKMIKSVPDGIINKYANKSLKAKIKFCTTFPRGYAKLLKAKEQLSR